jgi:hypothetical protein
MPTPRDLLKPHPFSEEQAQTEIVRLVRSEMARRGIGYKQLAAALAAHGVAIDERILRNKVARGTFSAAFLLQLLRAMRITRFATGLVIWEVDVATGEDREMAEEELDTPDPEPNADRLG